MKTKFCIVESPYAPFSKNDAERAAVELARNETYVNACMADSFARGEVPFASHAIYTRSNHGVKVLDDTIPEERKKGMAAGFALAKALFAVAHPGEASFIRAFYTDRDWTGGMADGLAEAAGLGQPTEKRSVADATFWSRENDAKWILDTRGQLYRWKKD